ncbi:phosphopantetheine-binding protein [Streptomyces sp. NPDC048611]|uniref:phosphopantetheine-binding protein n=1 Tax=Streptomyces sp. NPDC048611 TaxID=3155635 RepID=UPI00343BE4C8
MVSDSDTLDRVRGILADIGVDDGILTPEARLRADLGLDSTETTELELEFTEAFGVRVDLWDAHDHSLAELAELAATGSGAGQATGLRSEGTHR